MIKPKGRPHGFPVCLVQLGGLWDLVGAGAYVCRLGEWERSCGEHVGLMPGALGAGGGVRTNAPSGSLCVHEPYPGVTESLCP